MSKSGKREIIGKHILMGINSVEFEHLKESIDQGTSIYSHYQ